MTVTKPTTTQKGLGWRHRQQAESLHRCHQDGTECGWCGRPMYRDPKRNWDYNPDSTWSGNGKLQADHSKMSRQECLRRGLPIPPPDRLLHARCNIQRGEGTNDHLAATNATHKPTESLTMQWPWSA